MMIGHLPAGYLCTSALLDRLDPPAHSRRVLMRAGLAASVLPDLDVLFYHLDANHPSGHHAYWTHMPLFWLCVTLALLLIAWRLGRRDLFALVLVVGVNALLHVILDTPTGYIQWLAPWSDAPVGYVEIPNRYRLWPLNFFLHWTFALEIGVIVAAGLLYFRRRARRTAVELPGVEV
jgi:inner membrane protein